MTTADGELLEAGAEAKRTAALLRDARSALRKADTLAAMAMAIEDDTVSLIAEVRTALEQVVGQLTHHLQTDLRRARTAVRRR